MNNNVRINHNSNKIVKPNHPNVKDDVYINEECLHDQGYYRAADLIRHYRGQKPYSKFIEKDRTCELWRIAFQQEKDKRILHYVAIHSSSQCICAFKGIYNRQAKIETQFLKDPNGENPSRFLGYITHVLKKDPSYK